MARRSSPVLIAIIALAIAACGGSTGTALADVGVGGVGGGSAEPGGLKTLAEQHGIRFGSLYDGHFGVDRYDQIFEAEMNTLTAGTYMLHGGNSHTGPTEFDFSEMDAMVAWGRARDMEVHGHVLVWSDDIPDWLVAAPMADVEAIMNARIDTLVGRYAGQIAVWDVVNEAVDEDGALRQGHKWIEAMGDDYIAKAFRRAHAADPAAVLRYNEYNIESDEEQFVGVKALLTNLVDQGVPVRALGWQLHVKPHGLDTYTLLARMNEIADLGLDNYITELDVELPIDASDADLEEQRETYREVVETFLAAARNRSIVLWGLCDGDPWWLTDAHPLLFDESCGKKPAYLGVEDALRAAGSG